MADDPNEVGRVPNDGLTFSIDRDVCSGHGRCYSLAPQWFEPDESGHGVPKGDVEPQSSRGDMQFIVDSCPEEAISIVAAAPAGEQST